MKRLKEEPTAVEVLGYLRDDLIELEPVKSLRGVAVVTKPDVLKLISDWVEFCQSKK